MMFFKIREGGNYLCLLTGSQADPRGRDAIRTDTVTMASMILYLIANK